MYLETINRDQVLDSGSKIFETIAIVSEEKLHLFPNHRENSNGYFWIRIGENKKLRKDGSVEWSIMYDEFGNVKK
jgi:hypothetical protein